MGYGCGILKWLLCPCSHLPRISEVCFLSGAMYAGPVVSWQLVGAGAIMDLPREWTMVLGWMERERERGLCWVRREGAKVNVSNLSFGYFEPSPLLANIQGIPSLREMCVIQSLPLRPGRATLFTEKQGFRMRWSFFKALRCQFREKKKVPWTLFVALTFYYFPQKRLTVLNMVTGWAVFIQWKVPPSNFWL